MKARVALSGAAAVALAAPAAWGFSLDQGVQRRDPVEAAIAVLEARPESARAELRQLYEKYVDLLQRLDEEGWQSGLLSGEIVEHPDEPFLPARQLEDSLRKREKELSRLESALAKSPGGDEVEALQAKIAATRKAVKSLRRRSSRAKGFCVDWSDAVWAELIKLKPRRWSVTDRPRTAQPRHTGAVLCTPAEAPAICLVFDPWNRGEADVYEFSAWDQGSFGTRLPPEYFLHHLPEAE